MFFKKNQPKTDNNTRRRPPVARSSSVFSYHASRSVRPEAGSRSADMQSWLRPRKKPSKRPAPRTSWVRRAPLVALMIIVVALVINSLILSRDPEIITLADKQQQKVFLRSAETYQRAASDLFSGSIFNTNKLTIDTTGIAEAFRKQFPELAHVSVALPAVGHRPAVYIQPALPALLFRSADGSVYVLDAGGRALINASQTTKVERLGLPLVEDQSGLPVVLGKITLPSGNVAFIRETVGQLQVKKLKITGMALPKGDSELHIRLDGVPYIVKFNLRGDARAEAGAFLAVKQHLERENKVPAAYIDVRVDNRAYYR